MWFQSEVQLVIPKWSTINVKVMLPLFPINKEIGLTVMLCVKNTKFYNEWPSYNDLSMLSFPTFSSPPSRFVLHL